MTIAVEFFQATLQLLNLRFSCDGHIFIQVCKGVYTLGFHSVTAGRINGVAALTGLSLRKFMSVSLLQNKVAVITRWPYCKAGFHCTMLCRALTCLVLCRLQSPSKVLGHFHLYLVHID